MAGRSCPVSCVLVRATGVSCLAVLLCCLLAVQDVAGQKRRSARQGAGASSQEFARLAAQAAEAREAGRIDEAIEFYQKAVRLRPRWDEGWWYLATLLYDRDRYAEAARAFERAAALHPQAGIAWAMLGLCEFQLRQYDAAFAHIQRGRELGLVQNEELLRVLKYHEALLFLLKGDFETALQRLDVLANQGLNTEELIMALGLALLRIPILPSQLDPTSRDRELIRRLGWAELQAAQKNFTDAQREYERIAAEYAKTPNVQYAYGRYLVSRRDDDKALAAFKREIENSPQNGLARLQIAYIKLKNREPAEGIPFAEEAVRLNPRDPLAHYILGRLLFDLGQTARAIESLETARTLAPQEPKIYFALARAYARANRRADAEQAREMFLKLNKAVEEAENRGLKRADAIQEEPEKAPERSQ
ncbi:tetratricopeptide repeat protein [Pyrinomonas methylaliphatogenes]|uniref:TPR repeat/Tetratricopeptide repeat n=1 Tax=Pyrinomonas methylaliphatogenes TaxID=454194 RepID=A0A0B6WVS5_9BACT|nr:tetratricopeptide repeat protein [Pyrinomonas methylaliphatogenes]MBX5479302.1 tetratricopeptide repeat protein [Pyrinomonas methylaliphatogenes]CDM64384.1 TPR repeat/Tetratricopeptide repeat [Pyrinomonas methylaliphatogenes]